LKFIWFKEQTSKFSQILYSIIGFQELITQKRLLQIIIIIIIKVEISNDFEQIKNLKVKTSEDVAGFYQIWFHRHLKKTGNYRRSQKKRKKSD